MVDSPEFSNTEKKIPKKFEYFIGGTALAATIALCFAVVIFWDYVERAQQYG